MLNVPRDLKLFELAEPQHRNVSVKPAASPSAGRPRKATASKRGAARETARPSLKAPAGPRLQSAPMIQDGPSGPMIQDGPSGPMYS